MRSTHARKILVIAMIVASLGQAATYAVGGASGTYASVFGIPLWSTPLYSSPYGSSPWGSSPYSSSPYESTDPIEEGTPPVTIADGVPEGWVKTDRAEINIFAIAGDVDNRYYIVNGVGPTEIFDTPLYITTEGVSTLEYWGKNQLVEETPHHFAQIKIDRSAPSVPSGVRFASTSGSSARFEWNPSTDAYSGVAHYAVYTGGTLVGTVDSAQTSFRVNGIAPGQSVSLTVVAVDAVGNESAQSSAATFTMPAAGSTSSTAVSGTGSQSATVNSPVAGAVNVQFANVVTPGTITVTALENPPANMEGAFKVLGKYIDIDFSGQLASGSAITITLPYDPSIPDSRARNLKIKHWTGGSWVEIAPTVDTVHHTLTFTTSSLSPFAVAENGAVDASTKLAAGFGSATNTNSSQQFGWGKNALLVARLTDAGGAGMGSRKVVVESYNNSSKSWVYVADAAAGAAAGDYSATVNVKSKTLFRFHYAGDAYSSEAVSVSLRVVPGVALGAPKARSKMSHTKTYKVAGTITPAHKSASVRVYKYRKVGSKWKPFGYVKAKVTSSKGKTKYTVKLRLSKAGTWRIRARIAEDAEHGETWSGYDNIKVK